MKKILGATMIVAAAFAGSASAMDNPAQNAHAKLQQLWGNSTTYETGGQVSASRVDIDRPTLSTGYNRAKGTSAAARRLQAVQPTPAGR